MIDLYILLVVLKFDYQTIFSCINFTLLCNVLFCTYSHINQKLFHPLNVITVQFNIKVSIFFFFIFIFIFVFFFLTTLLLYTTNTVSFLLPILTNSLKIVLFWNILDLCERSTTFIWNKTDNNLFVRGKLVI